MNYQILVGQHNKFLFRTDREGLHTSDALVRVFSVFIEKFPASEGYYMFIEVSWKDSEPVNIKEFMEAIKAGKGKGFLMSHRNKRRRASWMAKILFQNIDKGLI